jgi:hypothetical protein
MGRVNSHFPEFDDTLPEIEGFEDVSWKNDTAPSMSDSARQLKLFVDFKDPTKSEHADLRLAGKMHRYQLISIDEHGESLTDVISTNDLNEVLEAIAAHDAEAAPKANPTVVGPRP